MWCTADIVEILKPKFVLWENVKNLLSKKYIHNFNAYIEIMNKLGYNSYFKVLNAKDFGIPQNRERVYTISIRKDIDNNNFTLQNYKYNTFYSQHKKSYTSPTVKKLHLFIQKRKKQEN